MLRLSRGLETASSLSMGRTWEKFSSLPAEKPRKFETATGKENFQSNRGGSH